MMANTKLAVVLMRLKIKQKKAPHSSNSEQLAGQKKHNYRQLSRLVLEQTTRAAGRPWGLAGVYISPVR